MELSLLSLLPLGLLAGLMSGLLGIGGGLVFSPLLLLLGLEPHQALATSSLAIVPTTLGGTWSHLRSHSLPQQPALAMALGAAGASLLFSQLGRLSHGAVLLALQAAMYGVLTVVLNPARVDSSPDPPAPVPWPAWSAVGLVAGMGTGLLGLGGGLVMVPLMTTLLRQPVRLAIRLSTLAVLVSAAVAAPVFISDERGAWPVALVLGGAAAIGAHWSAARLNRVGEDTLVWLLRGLTLLLALDSGRRALQLLLA